MISTRIATSSPDRIVQWNENWNPSWNTFLFYGSVGNDVFNLIFSKNENAKVFWFPLNNAKNFRTRAVELKKKFNDKLKIFPGDMTYQFKVVFAFDLIYWNGTHEFQQLKYEFNNLYRHSNANTQWVIHHCAPQRTWGKETYGYIRWCAENEYLKMDRWFEESSPRGVYDEAWCWVHFNSRPTHPNNISNDAWKMSPEVRKITWTPEWRFRERKVRITEWSSLVEKAQTADDYEELAKELELIEKSEYDEVDEWALKIWNKSPGKILRDAELNLKKQV